MLTVYCHAQIKCDAGEGCLMTFEQRGKVGNNGEAEGGWQDEATCCGGGARRC